MENIFDLTGKSAVITGGNGGNGGIGVAISKALVNAGCGVSIWGRNQDKTARAEQELLAMGGRVHSAICDVTDRSAVENAFEQAVEKFGFINGCFANAGIGGADRGSFLDRSFDEWKNMFDVNLDSTFHVLQVAVRHLVANEELKKAGGRLVAVSSIAALFGYAQNEHYGASKTAVNGLIRALGVELGRYGITANAILPGFSDTEMTEDLLENEHFNKAVMPRIPLRRYGEPDDFGGIAVYLMSDASSYHTADCFVIDGGFAAA